MHFFIEDYFIDDPQASSPNLSEMYFPPFIRPVQPFVITQATNFSFQQGQEEPLPRYIQLLQDLRINNNGNRNPQKQHVYEQYTRLRTQKPLKNILNLAEPYFKIKVIKNMNGLSINIPNEYIVNEFGMIDSLKNTDQEHIMIGRQDKLQDDNGETIYPNDIVLQEQDRLISRFHCRIKFKNYFSKEVIIKSLYKTTLKYLGLPLNVCSKIQKFLEEPKLCFVQDLGSVFGTHIRINKNEPAKTIIGQQFCVGTDTTFRVIDQHVLSNNLKYMDSEFEKIVNSIRSPHHICQIHGLTQLQKDSDQSQVKLTSLIEQLKDYQVPFLLLKFGGSGIPQNIFHLFFAESNNTTFSIGRANDNDVRINSNTISRKQTRFQYINNQWLIADGWQEKESANGTWLQIAYNNERQLRLDSEWHELRHLSEIKISDYILKIEYFRPKYQLYIVRKQQNIDKHMIKSHL